LGTERKRIHATLSKDEVTQGRGVCLPPMPTIVSNWNAKNDPSDFSPPERRYARFFTYP